MAIIAGRRAQELERAAGGLNRMGLAAANAVDPAMDDDVVHDVQARRSSEDEIVCVDAKKIRHETASRGEAVRTTIVTGIYALIDEVGGRVEHIEHGARKVDLLRARLAAGHIELEAASAELFRLRLELGDLLVKLFVRHLLVDTCHARLHSSTPGSARSSA